MTNYWEPEDWESKLPAKTRNLLANLRYQIRGLHKAVDNISVSDSDTTVDSEIGVHEEIGLGKGVRINFYPGKGRRTVDRIQVYLDQNNELQIQVDGEMHVLPRAGNSCSIIVKDRYSR